MAQTVQVGDVMNLAVEGRNDSGQKARLPAKPAWSVVPPGFVTLSPSGDGVTCALTAVAPGDCTLTVTSGGITPATYDISVLPGGATRVVVRLA